MRRMEEGTANRLRDLSASLSCKICFTLYSNAPFSEAFTLPCSHTFCHGCLDRLFQETDKQKRVCPLDRKALPQSIASCTRTRCVEEAGDVLLDLCCSLLPTHRLANDPVRKCLKAILPDSRWTEWEAHDHQSKSSEEKRSAGGEDICPKVIPSAPPSEIVDDFSQAPGLLPLSSLPHRVTGTSTHGTTAPVQDTPVTPNGSISAEELLYASHDSNRASTSSYIDTRLGDSTSHQMAISSEVCPVEPPAGVSKRQRALFMAMQTAQTQQTSAVPSTSSHVRSDYRQPRTTAHLTYESVLQRAAAAAPACSSHSTRR